MTTGGPSTPITNFVRLFCADLLRDASIDVHTSHGPDGSTVDL